MAVHDAVRMLGHDNPVSLLDPDGLYDRAVYTDMVVNQFNELKIFNESDDDDTTGQIIFDLQHDEDLRLGVQPRSIKDSNQFDFSGNINDFNKIITSPTKLTETEQ